ncbi:MAG: hypothetical protein ACYC6M_02440 [Terriglobales bacterium]
MQDLIPTYSSSLRPARVSRRVRVLWLASLAAVLLPGCNSTHTATVEPQSIPAFHPGPLQHCSAFQR